ncbi:MAG TPA: chemotaxis protein CheW, partial [Gemmatimonadaceae bacterium]|nr:chemotaxis protein CheW [Gemmatimonadaceae bacterium]
MREIIPFRRATRLPGAPPYVAGLMNVRGIIVTVLDIGVRLDATAPDRTTGSVMLIEHGTKVVGAAVDEVLD